MYEELASIRSIVALSPDAALDEAEAFLTRLGYMTVQRTDTSLRAERRQPDRPEEQDTPSLTVEAVPQMGGGVWIRVRGNDREGVQEQQAAWTEWSESLPKKTEAQTTPPADQQPNAETHDVPLPPPPTVESHGLPPPWQTSSTPSFAPTQGQGSNARRVVWVLGGCIVLPLLLVGFVGCLAILGSVAEDSGTPSGRGSGTTYTKDNWSDLVADPDSKRGASVDITGKVFRPPDVGEREAVFQMWADPENAEWNTMVHTDPGSAKVKSDDYVRVQGTVRGSFEGENPFSGTISAVEIEADSVEGANPTEVQDPGTRNNRSRADSRGQRLIDYN